MTHCPTCSGLGIVWDAGDMMVCPTCDGEGVLNEAPMLLYWRDLVRVMAAVSRQGGSGLRTPY